MANTFSFEEASQPLPPSRQDKPSSPSFDQASQPVGSEKGKRFSFEEAQGGPPPAPSTTMKDHALSFVSGVEKIPSMLAGLADIPLSMAGLDRPVSRATDAIGEMTGFQPSKWAKETEDKRSEGFKTQQQTLNSAWDRSGADDLSKTLFSPSEWGKLPEQWGKLDGKDLAKTVVQNPGAVISMAAESLPSMAVGGAAGKGIKLAAKAAGLEGLAGGSVLATGARAGAGEGAVTAGQVMSQIDPTVDPQSAARAAAGAGGISALIGGVSGGLASKIGLPDLEMAMAGGKAGTSSLSLAKRVPAAMLQEGLLEELPQSAQEQIWQNAAEGKPLGEGVLRQGIEGALAGAATGGAFGALPISAKNQSNQQQPPAAETPPAETPPPAAAPAPAPVLDEQALERAGVMPPPVLDEQQISRKVDLSGTQGDQGQADAATGESAPTDLRQTIEDTTGISGRAAPGGSRLKDLKAAFDEQIEPQVIIDDTGKVSTTTSKLEFQQFQADYENRVALRQRNIEAGRRLHAARAGINPDDGPLSAGAAIALESAASGQQDQPLAAEAEARAPVAEPQATPSGSFGAMNDLADLVSQERQDVTQRRAGIADRQGQRREFDLAEADRRTAESMQREAQARRRAVLDAVLADPETTNPAGRFAATLRREGYRDSSPTADELQTIQRFEDVRAAQPAPLEVEPSAPNELDPAALGIRERRAPAEKSPLASPRNLREGLERVRAARAAAAATPATPAAVSPAETWARMDAGQRTALAGRLQGVPPIVSKNVHRADWAKINPALQGKLAEAMQPRAAIDVAAHEAATSPRNDRAQPTEAQAKAGNYKKGHVSVSGLDIAIENPEGSTRSGIDPGGKPWSVTMGAHYGYVKRTQGADGDQVDVYIAKADPVQSPVFVVDQFDNRTGKFDEHKAILGASSLEEARALYDAHFSDGKGAERRGAITPMGFDAFKDWAKSGNTAAPLGQRIAAPIDKKPGAAAVAAGGGQRGESASPAVGRALQILMDRTDGVGAPDGLGGPEHADARTAIVSALTGERAADIEAAPNFKFRTSVPQVERLLYDAAGIPAGKTLNERRAPFMDWLDQQQAGGAAQASPESTARAEALDQEMARKLQEAEGGDTAAEQDAPADGLRFSRSPGQAGEFVAAPDGSIDFGEITPEMAQAMRRQAGKIRLERGDYTYGLEHIEARHGDQIRSIGFESVEAFVADAVRHIDSIWLPTKTSQLVVLQSEERGKAVFIELKPAESGDYYTVNTAFPVGEGYAQNKEKRGGWRELWSREPVPASTPGGQSDSASTPLKAGEVPSMDRGQSSVTSVANPDAAGSPTAQKSAGPALPRPSITAESLPAIFAERFPKLASAIRTMLDRGALGQPGGLVVIGNAQEFADHSGRKLDDAVQLFESRDGIHPKGLYDSKTGITYLVGPNLTQDSASAVVLHEMVHGQQRQALDQKALALIEGRAKEAPALRAFLDKVATRMEAVGEAGNPFEATSYIVEMAAQEGRQSGFSRADGPILAWIEHNIGRKVADMVRDFVATVRAWALAHGVELKAITVDDLVAYAMAGVGKAARGKVVTDGKAGQVPAFSRGAPEGTGAGRVAERLRDTAARAAGRPRPDPNDPFSAENIRLREQDKSLWQKAKGQLRRWLAPGGLLPDSVFVEKIARDSKFQAVEFDIRHIVGGFEQAVKQDFGTPFDKLTQAQQRTLSEALAGKVAGSLPKATKTAVVAMRQYIDSLSGEYLQIIQGRIDALQARAEQSGRDADKAQAINEIRLYEKIRNNVGAYVHRSYQAFDDPKWFQKVPTATLNAARQYLKDGYMEGGKTGEAEALRLAEVALAEILKNGTAYDSMESFIAEGKLGAKDLSVLMRRKDVPPVIRALLGEYADPRLNFTKSATKMGRLIWNQRFLDRVREMGMGTFLFEGKDRPPSATTQIAAQGSEVYAPLNGLWTFPEVAQSFKDALGKEQMGELYRFIVRANGFVKYGKAQPLDAEIKTPSGPIRMGDVEVGAVVCGIDGPTTVTGVFPQGEMDVYRLTFCDGSSTEASDEHLWNVEILAAGLKTLTTAEIMALPSYRITKRQVAIPLGRAHFDASDVPLDPYFMGVLLGDGSFRGNMVRLSSPDKDIIERVRATLPEGYAIDSPPSWAAIDYAITAPNLSEGRRHKVKAALKEMGLWGHTSLDKFIPAQYLRNTVEVRMEVARGLLDTDGWVDLLGQPHFGTSSRRLAEDFRELAESLGASVMWNEKESASGNTAYDLGVRVEDARAWFWLSRKAQKATPRKKPAKRTITSIEYVGKKQCQCIMVDDPRHLYLTDRFIVTHNTVLSPTTAMRNWQSAMFFALANGHFDLTQMKKSVAAFREQVRQNATGDDLAYLRHLKELGVVYDTPYAGEMMRFIEDAKADSGVDTVMRAFGASDGAIAKGLRGVKQINQVAQGFYSFGDDFWKIIGFENEKAGLLKAGLPVAEAEREAAKRIRDTYPTYSMVGAGIQKLSRFPLMGTFVSFPAEIVRTSANMLRTTAADLKSDNPALRALGMKRAVGMAMVSGLFYGLAALSKAGSGVDDDEEEALRDLAPEWQKNSTFLFAGRDEKGQLRYFDMSFLDPYGYWKRPITAMLRDQPWEKSAASAIKDMLTPFFGADIATAAIFQVLANKKDSGGKVYQEGADALDQAGAIANHLRKALQPGFVGNIERLMLAAQGIRREGSGQPYDLNDEMTALLGWRASTMDPKTALYYRSFEFNDAMTEAKQVLTRTLRSVNPVSPEDIRDAREVAQSRQAEAFTEMRRLVQAAQAAGMNPAQIRQVLKQSSISQANAEALMRGRPPRLVLGVPAAAKAVQQARAMEGPEFAQEVAKRYRMASGM